MKLSQLHGRETCCEVVSNSEHAPKFRTLQVGYTKKHFHNRSERVSYKFDAIPVQGGRAGK